MGGEGLEQTQNTREKQRITENAGPISGPPHGPGTKDAELQAVIDRWFCLSGATRRQILRLAMYGTSDMVGGPSGKTAADHPAKSENSQPSI